MMYHQKSSLLILHLALLWSCILENCTLVMAKESPISLSTSITKEQQGFTPWNDQLEQSVRHLELTQNNGKCWSTRDDRNPNRYCMFDDTPRSGAFLSLSCPTSKDNNLSNCQCTIGIGDSKDAPNTDTCWKCGFCRDGSLAYDCRNVAEGTCIGRNCFDDCLSSYKDPEDLYLGSSATTASTGLLLLLPSIAIVSLL